MDEHGVVTGVIEGDGGEKITFSTLRFGDIAIASARILEFPHGLVGMPEARRFVLLHQEEGKGPFFWMQSVDDPALAFVVCEPQIFFPDYSVPLTTAQQEALRISAEEDGTVCVILVVPEDPRRITANLRGPIVINMVERLGYQLVLAGDEYPVKAPLFADPTMEGEVNACSNSIVG